VQDIPTRFHIGDTVVRARSPRSPTSVSSSSSKRGSRACCTSRELADHKVENPEDVVKVGQKVEVRILKIEPEERKLGLTLVQAHYGEGKASAGGEDAPRREPQTESESMSFDDPSSLAAQLKDLGSRLNLGEEEQGGADAADTGSDAPAEAEAEGEGEDKPSE
jgi:small subunit ribosomal protein S1